MEKFRGKYRIESNRLKGWNYAENGMYFLTIVTQNRECNLGNIENDEMILSCYGKIVESEWLKSFEIRNELFLDEFILMPNHLHAIVVLEKLKNDHNDENGLHGFHVETHGRASLPEYQPNRLPKSISSFIGGLKSTVNTKIDDYIDENNLIIPKYNRNNHFFQSNYYDHIIRNDGEYQRIKNYIRNNPRNWNEDKLKT